MSDLFTKLIGRSRGTERSVRPRLPGLFEPTGFDIQGWGELAEEMKAPEKREVSSTQPRVIAVSSQSRRQKTETTPPRTPSEVLPQTEFDMNRDRREMRRIAAAVPPPARNQAVTGPPAPPHRTPTAHQSGESVEAVVRTRITEVQQMTLQQTPSEPTLQGLIGPAAPEQAKTPRQGPQRPTPPPSPLPIAKTLRPTRESSGGPRKVEIRIGSIEVRGTRSDPPTAPKRAPRPGPKTSLSDYLARRRESRR